MGGTHNETLNFLPCFSFPVFCLSLVVDLSVVLLLLPPPRGAIARGPRVLTRWYQSGSILLPPFPQPPLPKTGCPERRRVPPSQFPTPTNQPSRPSVKVPGSSRSSGKIPIRRSLSTTMTARGRSRSGSRERSTTAGAVDNDTGAAAEEEGRGRGGSRGRTIRPCCLGRRSRKGRRWCG